MSLADCFFTMLLILAPYGTVESRFEDLRFSGPCAKQDFDFRVVPGHRLKVITKWTVYVIPLPQRLDTVRLSYRMQAQYAYLGDCLYGLTPYTTYESSCQRVMARFGPPGTY